MAQRRYVQKGRYSMRVIQLRSIVVLLLASSLVVGFQSRRFTRDDLEYELQLPSPAWRTISRIDVHGHLEFVNGTDPANGYLRLRKILVEQPATPAELFRQDEKWELQHLSGYVVCSDCKGVSFEGKLSGAVFSYEYVAGGRTMYGRIYYLEIDKHTFYSLRFTVARNKLAAMRDEMDVIAGSFQLKHRATGD